MAPHVLKRAARAIWIARKVPRRRQSDDPFAFDDICSGDGHGAAEAIADECDRLADAAQQRHEQFLNMSGDRPAGARVRFAPVEQQRTPAHPGDGGG
jgi:hypothetical protein